MSHDTLETFRTEWVIEINNDIQDTNNSDARQKFKEGHSVRKHSRAHEEECHKREKLKRKCEPDGLMKGKSSSSNNKDKLNLENGKEENLLDILIADIDELVSLPFFDLELPKEIAIKIFSFLSIKDLINCTSVNSSWKILADDDLIWYNMCKKYGYVEDTTCVLDREDWKSIFKLKFQNDKKFKLNWKQRICQTSELEYEKGGILYAASIFNDQVIAGYANGLIKLWDICKDSPMASFGSLLADSEPDNSIDSSINGVTMNGFVCAAGYNSGAIKIWQNGLNFSLIDSFTLDSRITAIHASERSPSVLSASGNTFRIDASDQNGQWKTVCQQKVDQNIKSVHLYGGCDEISVIHTQNYLEIYCKDGTKHQFEKTISAEVSCICCQESTVAVGITPLDFSILEGYRVKTYSICDGRMHHLMKGPHSKVLCLCGFANENNVLAVGCSDKRIRIHDGRLEDPVITLRGLSAPPCSLQIDEWKVVSGDTKGFISVWDQRSRALLWQTSARHPVRICKLSGPCLVCVSIPTDKNPRETLWYADDLIQHRRHRGNIRIFDFAVENNTTGIPDICQSNYDNYAGYNYNINLVTPYDEIS